MSTNIDPSLWRLTTPGGIPLKVVERSGSFGEEEATASESYIIEADNLLAFALESFPLPFSLYGTIFYPDRRRMPGLAPLTTKRISWEGFTDGLPVDPFGSDLAASDGTYQDFVKVTIEYGTTPANDQEQDPNDPKTFLEVSANASGVFLNANASGTAKWDEAGADGVPVQKANIPNTVIENLIEWTTTWSQIPYVYFNDTLVGRLRAKMGKVNSEVMSLFNDAPAETILFLGYSMRNQYTWRDGYTGVSPVQLEMKFLEKGFESRGTQITHNYFYDPDKPGWRKLFLNGLAPYEDEDLNEIFQA